MQLVGTTLAGRYRLNRLVGDGGMAAVFDASDLLLSRRVAVKLLHQGLTGDPAFLARFWQEAQAAAGVAHPSVVGVYDFGEHGGNPFIVLELVEGEPLDKLLVREGPLSPERAVSIAAGVCDALHAAHAGGLVHRDVKPANVMVCPDGSIKVMDFGLARAVEAACGLTDPGTVVGTAYYIAPEQALGKQAEARSDLYALGICLYEMLGGERPFSGSAPVDIAIKHVSGAPRPLDELRPDLPAALVAVVHQALAKRPQERQPSALALREQLERAIAPDHVDNTVGGPTERTRATAPLPAIGADPAATYDDESADDGAGAAWTGRPAWTRRGWRQGRRRAARRALVLAAIVAVAMVAGSATVLSLWRDPQGAPVARGDDPDSFTQPPLEGAGGPASTAARPGHGASGKGPSAAGGGRKRARERLGGRTDSGPPLKPEKHGKKQVKEEDDAPERLRTDRTANDALGDES